MPYAANGTISTEAFDGAVEITQEQYDAALEGMMAGKVVAVDGGFAVVDPPESELEPAPEILPPAPDPKLIGIEFDGVMCSATEADQNGLASVLVAIQFQGASFSPTRFDFANGNSLTLSLENYQQFAAVWLPFRQSFFQP